MNSHEQDLDVGRESSTTGEFSRKTSRLKSSLRTIWTLLILLALQNMAVKLMNLPLNRVIELRYCQQYYFRHDPTQIGPGGSIAERLCKLDSIQQKLAWMQGMIETFHIVCGMFAISNLVAQG
jgi:hypothetical protein